MSSKYFDNVEAFLQIGLTHEDLEVNSKKRIIKISLEYKALPAVKHDDVNHPLWLLLSNMLIDVNKCTPNGMYLMNVQHNE